MTTMESLAKSMNLYFILGGRANYDRYIRDFDNANLKPRKPIPKWLLKEFEQFPDSEEDVYFDEWAYRIWCKSRGSYEKEYKCCLRILKGAFIQNDPELTKPK